LLAAVLLLLLLLRAATAAHGPRSMPAAMQATPATREATKKDRLICVLVKDEAKHLAYWLDFHLNVAGFTRVIIYNDHSTDDIAAVVARFAPRVSVVDVDWPYRRGSHEGPHLHYQFTLQLDVYARCYQENWDRAEALVTIDVDEFFYPARSHWDAADPFAAAAAHVHSTAEQGPLVAAVMGVHCFRYGLNGHVVDPPADAVLESYPMRGETIGVRENDVKPMTAAAQRACALNVAFCANLPTTKVIALPNGWDVRFRSAPHVHLHTLPHVELRGIALDDAEARAMVDRVSRSRARKSKGALSPDEAALLHYQLTHGFVDLGSVLERIRTNRVNPRTHGFACDHIQFRSLQSMRDKVAKNGNPGYNVSALSVDAGDVADERHPIWLMYERVRDTMGSELRARARGANKQQR